RRAVDVAAALRIALVILGRAFVRGAAETVHANTLGHVAGEVHGLSAQLRAAARREALSMQRRDAEHPARQADARDHRFEQAEAARKAAAELAAAAGPLGERPPEGSSEPGNRHPRHAPHSPPAINVAVSATNAGSDRIVPRPVGSISNTRAADCPPAARAVPRSSQNRKRVAAPRGKPFAPYVTVWLCMNNVTRPPGAELRIRTLPSPSITALPLPASSTNTAKAPPESATHAGTSAAGSAVMQNVTGSWRFTASERAISKPDT